MRPTKAQEQILLNTLITSRKMYNSCLEELITHYKETGKYMHLYEQDKRHGKEAHPDLPAVVVDTTLKRLHRSFTRPVPSPPRAEFLDHLFQYPLFARNQARAKGQYLGATPIKPPARLACRGAAA